ncbi:helix-turn-helix domain-containing protein [Sinomicrobium weinanense]|uniref:Helix-turn-helix domain-containing protein n=1 Tax=Sinomicrobium weinanense TaxID=2842200 RepID=A0A926Q594_9FLAO|nr:helix-turn-helix domain-containing protein [Sinomicrobium weinanense]MBC9797710.1 helix-turn-helix domain-containing protein [Sinomicrobium weinanense]MBU3122264.1 helix-turn-helix domain-containing protein [Sinomicrobium weinanense]
MKPNLNDEKWYDFFYMLKEMSLGNFSYRLKISGIDSVCDDFARTINLMAVLMEQDPPYLDFTDLPEDSYLTMAFVLDDDFCIRKTNRTASHFFNREPHELPGKPFVQLLSTHSRVFWDAIQAQLLQRKSPLFNTMCFDLNCFDEIQTISCFFRSPVNGLVYVTSKAYSVIEDSPDRKLTREMQAVERHIVDKKQADDEKRIRELAEYMECHFDKPLPTAEELSKTLGINQQKLKIEFKRLFGKTTYEFYQDKRMEKACEYLCHTSMSNLEVAEKLGFISESGFYRAFKSKYGCTPGELRKKNVPENKEVESE